jgi:ParB/RepB/Spo0J family partition protein
MPAKKTKASAEVAPPPADDAAPAHREVPRFIPLTHADITPDPGQARKVFDAEALAQLAETLFTHGMQQPPVVAGVEGQEGFQLVAGERRWRAWGLLIADGRWPADHTEPCRLETADDRTRIEAALIENLQRVDLNHMEAGEAFELLGIRFHLSNKDIAAKIGRTPEYVQQHRRLTKLDADDREAVRSGEMTLDEARQTLAKPTPAELTNDQRVMFAEVLHRITKKPLSGSSYYSLTECSYLANQDGNLQQLINLKLLRFGAQDYQTLRAYVGLEYEGNDLARHAAFKRLRDKKTADDALANIRRNPLREPPDPVLPKGQTYLTTWLNGPFTLSAEAQAVLDTRAKQEAENKAHAAKREAEEAAAKARVKTLAADINGQDTDYIVAKLIENLALEKFSAPFTATQYGYLHDSRSRQILSIMGWGPRSEALAIVLAALLNRLVPVTPETEQVEEPADIEARDEDDLEAVA